LQAGKASILALCEAANVSRATVYRWIFPKKPKLALARQSGRRISTQDRDQILNTLCTKQFIDKSPSEAFYTLLSDGIYYCSERSMYRILKENQAVKERRNQLIHPKYSKPELLATGPNQVWSWDITLLQTIVSWSYYYFYVILDIFSRMIVGWLISRSQTGLASKQLLEETIKKYELDSSGLIVHSDRGTQMKSKTVAQMLSDLDAVQSFSRPHVSNDNPFSESLFRTSKYNPMYPGKFTCIEEAQEWAREFVGWYNEEHHHSGIAYLTPAEVHFGQSELVLCKRHQVMMDAYMQHPERFSAGPPKRQYLAPAVYINPPEAKKACVAEVCVEPVTAQAQTVEKQAQMSKEQTTVLTLL